MRDKNGFLAVLERRLNALLGEDVHRRPKGTLLLMDVIQESDSGKSYIYIPDKKELFRWVRDEEIRLQFRGDNYEELALTYRLTLRQIRNIVNEINFVK